VGYIVPGTEALEFSYVVAVHLSGVAGHGLSQLEGCWVARAQEGVPQPVVWGQLGVVPGVSANIVLPAVAGYVLGVHEVAVVPEPIPVVGFHHLVVVDDAAVQLVFDPVQGGLASVGQAPVGAKGPCFFEILRSADQACRLRALPAHLSQLRPRRHGGHREQKELAGAGYSVGSAQPFLYILVGSVQVVGNSIVVAQVHRFGIRGPQPDGEFCLVAPHLLDFERGGEGLPEVFEAHSQATADIPGVRQSSRTLPGVGGQPAGLGASAFDDAEAIGR